MAIGGKGAEVVCEGQEGTDGPCCARAGIGGWLAIAIIGCKADLDGTSWVTGAA